MKAHLIFAADNSFISKTIRWVTGGDWSHVAFVYDNELLIEAALGYGIRFVHKDNYEQNPNCKYTYCRIKGLTKTKLAILKTNAKKKIGTKYDLLGQIGVLAKLIVKDLKIPFVNFKGRNKAENPNRDWCSEFVDEEVTRVGIDLIKEHSTFATPAELFGSDKVKEV